MPCQRIARLQSMALAFSTAAGTASGTGGVARLTHSPAGPLATTGAACGGAGESVDCAEALDTWKAAQSTQRAATPVRRRILPMIL
jgi:hypothetical protein